ncbi:MAG: TraR/DksA C4-type zinc finger protein [Pseudomonadota bacterium]
MTIIERDRQLRLRLAELEDRLQTIDHTLEASHSRDWEEQAVEREDDEVLEDLGNAGAEEIGQIRAALGRIEAGIYGLCTRCGTEISAKRLDVLPATPFCRHCAA